MNGQDAPFSKIHGIGICASSPAPWAFTVGTPDAGSRPPHRDAGQQCQAFQLLLDYAPAPVSPPERGQRGSFYFAQRGHYQIAPTHSDSVNVPATVNVPALAATPGVAYTNIPC